MNRRERLMATVRGETVDRPAVCFYEINGHDEDPTDPSPFNIYNDPSWAPLLALARERTDRIVIRHVALADTPTDPMAARGDPTVTAEAPLLDGPTDVLTARTTTETWTDAHGSRFTRSTLRLDDRTLTRLTRRDPDLNTVWMIEHPLKDVDDLRAYLRLPEQPRGGAPDTGVVLETEARLGDSGIVMIDTSDPLCPVADMFDMATYTVIALTEPALMHQALERQSRRLLPEVEAVAAALPGRLWRIYGPEYASPPYLPPRLFEQYVTRYIAPMVETIHRHGGYARIHSHGRLKEILDPIAATGCDGLDPVEPPPQGDVSLGFVRGRYGRQWVLFGNIEASDIVGLPTDAFAGKVATALREGTAGDGRGFVLMPSAAPYGRRLPDLALRNYETMVEMAERG